MGPENVDKADWDRYMSRQARSETSSGISPNKEQQSFHKRTGFENAAFGTSDNSNRGKPESHAFPSRNRESRNEDPALWRRISENSVPASKPATESMTAPRRNTDNISTHAQMHSIHETLNNLNVHENVEKKANASSPRNSAKQTGVFNEIPGLRRQDSIKIDFDDDSFQDDGFIEEQISFHISQALESWKQRKYDDQEAHLNVLIYELSGTHILSAKVDKACTQILRGGSKEALSLLREYRYDAASPPYINMAVYYTRGVAAVKLGEFETALLDCKRGIALFSKLPLEKKADHRSIRLRIATTKLASQIYTELKDTANSSFYQHLAATLDPIKEDDIELSELYPKTLFDIPDNSSIPQKQKSSEPVIDENPVPPPPTTRVFKEGSNILNDRTKQEKKSESHKKGLDHSDDPPVFKILSKNPLLAKNHFTLIQNALGTRLVYLGTDSSVPVLLSTDDNYCWHAMSLLNELMNVTTGADIELLEVLFSLRQVASVILSTELPRTPTGYKIHGKPPKPSTPLQLLILLAATHNFNDDVTCDLAMTLIKSCSNEVDPTDISGCYTTIGIAALTGQAKLAVFLHQSELPVGSLVDNPTPDGFSPIRCAIYYAGRAGDTLPLAVFLRKGVSVLGTDSKGYSNLHFAALTADHGDVIRFLLKEWPTERINDTVYDYSFYAPMYLSAYQIAQERAKDSLLQAFHAHNIRG